MTSEGRKLAQNNIKLDTTGWERLSTGKFKCDHMDKWYTHSPESFLENETTDLVIVNKEETCCHLDSCKNHPLTLARKTQK